MTASDRLRRAVRRARDARWSGVHATHLGLLDAATLWVAFPDLPTGARLALRGPDGTTDLGVASSSGLAAGIDLTPYAARAGAREGLDLVVLDRGRELPVRPAFMSDPGERPVVAPRLPGTDTAWRLELRPAARLRLVDLPRGVAVRAMGVVDDELTVLLDLPREATPTVRLQGADGAGVLLEGDMTADGWSLRLAAAQVGGLEVPHLFLAEVDGRTWPLVRAASDLRDARGAVPLPLLAGADDWYVAVAWRADGALTARRTRTAEGLT